MYIQNTVYDFGMSSGSWLDVIISHYICPAQILSLSKKCVNKAVLNKLTEF